MSPQTPNTISAEKIVTLFDAMAPWLQQSARLASIVPYESSQEGSENFSDDDSLDFDDAFFVDLEEEEEPFQSGYHEEDDSFITQLLVEAQETMIANDAMPLVNLRLAFFQDYAQRELGVGKNFAPVTKEMPLGEVYFSADEMVIAEPAANGDNIIRLHRRKLRG